MGIGKAIVVLIILGILAYVLISVLPNLKNPLGDGIIPPPPKYKNDIITVESSTISNSNPYSDSTTTLTLLIKNNGDRILDDVEVNFFNVPGFTVTELRCENPESLKDRACVYSRDTKTGIDPLDTREISLVLKAPEINTQTPFSISYFIKYDYSGYRTANIPIIDGRYRNRPFSQFSQSTPSYGPIVLDFESRVGSERQEDSQTIKEYWSRAGEPFEVKMNFKHVGSSSLGTIKPVNLTARSVSLDLNNSLVVAPGPCNFEKSGNYLVSTRSVLVPGTLLCTFNSSQYFVEPEMTAVINAEFNYTYQFTRTESLTVQPLPKE